LKYRHFISTDATARKIARRQGRQYDLDLLRHAITLAFFRTHLNIENEPDPMCIIGDGYANMSTVILGALPKSRVILVNLNKTLIVDLICLRKGLPDINYALVRNEQELEEALNIKNIRAIAITADDAQLIEKADISVAVNIESMMEMDPSTTSNYFQYLRNCGGDTTAFYCNNNEEKILPDGTASRFFEYPWHDKDLYLLDERCPWRKYKYGFNPPLFYKRCRHNPHRLAILAKSADI
jgi:putative sugar O-methyltransferase